MKLFNILSASFSSGVIEIRTKIQLIPINVEFKKIIVEDSYAREGAAFMHVGTGISCQIDKSPIIPCNNRYYIIFIIR